jgi:hypothetical protein
MEVSQLPDDKRRLSLSLSLASLSSRTAVAIFLRLGAISINNEMMMNPSNQYYFKKVFIFSKIISFVLRYCYKEVLPYYLQVQYSVRYVTVNLKNPILTV